MSKNAFSEPDNPQERFLREIPESMAWFLTGFTEGEGSFNLSVAKRKDYSKGWKFDLSFNISQKEGILLQKIKSILRCGTIRSRKDGVYAFEVRSLKDIRTKIIPFFEYYSLLSYGKKKSFSAFKEISEIMENKEHLTKTGIKKILRLRNQMNIGRGRKRKYSDDEILSFS